MKCSYPIADYPVYRFSMPVVGSSMYLVPAGKSCLVVDPCVSPEAETLLRELRTQECLVLLTHEHYDHISGVNRLRELLPCRVVCTDRCAERITDCRKNCAAYVSAMVISRSEREQREFSDAADAEYTCRADQTYSGELRLNWQGLELVLREAPGHSPGSQIIETGKHWYFTGDSLIPGLEVITRLPGGSRRAFEALTRPYLETIAAGSVVFPGHGAESLLPAHSDT